MKILLTISALLISSFIFSQSVKSKNYKDSSGTYLIKYYLTGEEFTPLTNPVGEVHYKAWIMVYKIDNKDTIPVWNLFEGHFTYGGCCDQPSWWVGKAKKGDRKKERIILDDMEDHL